jgi:uncharacterized protein
VIVDAAFLRRGERLRFLDLAASAGARAVILHCRAPEETLRQRVAARQASRSDASEAGLAVLARQPSYWEDFDGRERAHLLEVDTGTGHADATALAALRPSP